MALSLTKSDESLGQLRARWRRTRATTERLAEPLTVEDQAIQTMPDVSPTKWHLAHTTWFWETFALGPMLKGYEVRSADYGYLYNSYYEHEGDRHARPERGFLSRPSLDEVRDYRRHVDDAMEQLFDRAPAELAAIAELGVAHEEQHQELILTDIKHVLSRNPLSPAAFPARNAGLKTNGALTWTAFEGGRADFGAPDAGFSFDNERPRHPQILQPFALADRSVTNGEWLEFMSDGGYDTATLWLADGWAAVQERGWRAPLHWRQRDAWREFTLHGECDIDPHAPVAHVSFYEASAFAEWTGWRLPEEREWELAALNADPGAGDFMEPGVSSHPASESGNGLRQLFGGVWEWTRSAYAPYPGYRAPPGAVGEYNGKFMCGQFVLRGGSCATPRGHVRPTYRNFMPPDARWQFSGVRLVREL